jgi:hypothetical protein
LTLLIGAIETPDFANAQTRGIRGVLKSAAQDFLEKLAGFPPDTFEGRFSHDSARLGLAEVLDRNELTLLYEAAFRGSLCHAAINGCGRGRGAIRPDNESQRTKLEWDFMTARAIFCASPGWQTLAASAQDSIEGVFLTVFVSDENLR